MSIDLVMPSKHLILCHPLLLLPSVLPSTRVFSNESALLIRWPKYWSFSFNISPSNEYSGLISFRKWLVWSPCCPRDSQESSPAPQFKSINSSLLSSLYGPTLTSVHDYWKTRALTMQTCVREVMSLLFNMLSRFVIAFLPRSKRVLIAWLQSSSSVILEPKKIRSVIVLTFSLSSRVLFSELISRFLNWCKCPWNASLTRAAGTESRCGVHSKPTDSSVT